jgi:MFS family permease
MAIVLGLVTAVGPFAIDMYLPALPTMGQHLQASPGAVQMSLMAFFIVIGVCQLFYGPLSDIVGRKPRWRLISACWSRFAWCRRSVPAPAWLFRAPSSAISIPGTMRRD